jgi:hypothetical protein
LAGMRWLCSLSHLRASLLTPLNQTSSGLHQPNFNACFGNQCVLNRSSSKHQLCNDASLQRSQPRAWVQHSHLRHTTAPTSLRMACMACMACMASQAPGRPTSLRSTSFHHEPCKKTYALATSTSLPLNVMSWRWLQPLLLTARHCCN